MNEQQLKEAFIQYLQQKSGAQTEKELEAYIQLLGAEGIQQEYAQFMQMIKQLQFKFGGMLNYIEKLRGVCPEGYETQFFRNGGNVTCKRCVKKAKMEDGGEMPKNPIDAFRCGRKMKKKKENGGNIEIDKCGNKMKKVTKAQLGTDLPTAEPAFKRYKGGTYRGPEIDVLLNPSYILLTPIALPKTENIRGPKKSFRQPANMFLQYDPVLGDSTITETPAHYESAGFWFEPESVKVQPRLASNRKGDQREWEVMKRRWEEAKKAAR